MSVAATAPVAPRPSARANIAAGRLRFIGRAMVLVPPSVLADSMLQISYSCGKSCQYLMVGALPGRVYLRLNQTACWWAFFGELGATNQGLRKKYAYCIMNESAP